MKTVNYNGDTISKLALGTVQFGLEYGIANKIGQPSIKEVKKIIDYVQEHGINCFDTAAAYGSSEEVLGKVLKKTKKAYIISKISSDNFVDNCQKHIDLSLKRLQTKGLYAILLHDSKLLSQWDKSFDALISNLIDSKKIKYFGVSIYTENDFDNALANDMISIIQIPFNLFDQRALKLNWFEKAKAKNKLIFIRSIYLQGLFFMDKNSLPKKLEKAKQYLNQLHDYCKHLNTSVDKLALSFVNSTAKENIILFGCDSFLQAQENIETFNNLENLSDSIISELHKSFKNVPEDIYNPTRW